MEWDVWANCRAGLLHLESEKQTMVQKKKPKGGAMEVCQRGFLQFVHLGFYKPLPSVSVLFFCKCLYFVDYNVPGFFQTLQVSSSHPCAFIKPPWEVLQRQSQYRVLMEFRRDCIIGFSPKVQVRRVQQGQFNYLIGISCWLNHIQLLGIGEVHSVGKIGRGICGIGTL